MSRTNGPKPRPAVAGPGSERGKSAGGGSERGKSAGGGSERGKSAGGETIGLWSAVAIGVGGMVGGGIFAVLGLAVQLARGGTPVAFAVGGLLAAVTAYSYAKLSVRYPSQGGTVLFIDRAFGRDLLTGALNSLLWMSYVVMLALYSFAFGSYGSTFFAPAHGDLATHLLLSGAILVPMGINMLAAGWVGRTERLVVGIKVTILVVFVAAGATRIHPASLAPHTWTGPLPLLAGGMIIFVAYEGFELIANAAQDVRDPGATLPRAFAISVGFVIALYLAIAAVAVGSLPTDTIVAAKDYALAEVARPIFGSAGFRLIAITALLSTFSAINATLYGASRLSHAIAREGELPAFLGKSRSGRPIEGLVITAALALALANVADLTRISTMGSAAFLLVFAAVNAANARLARETRSTRWISLAGIVLCVVALGALIWHTASQRLSDLWVLIAMVGVALGLELLYREARGRHLRL